MFNEWYGFLYYANESRKTFVMEKNFAGCLGFRVINRSVAYTTPHKVQLKPGESIIFIVKRISS